MISCKQCGNENRETARFCLSCGAKLEHPAPPETLPAAAAEPTPPSNESELAKVEASQVEPVEETVEVEPSTEPDQTLEAEIIVEEPEPAVINKADSSLPDDPQPALEEEISPDIEAEEVESTPSAESPEEQAPPAEEADEPPTEEDVESESVPPPAPMEPGTILAGRYELLQVLEETDATILYQAIDRGRCPQCGYADSEIGDVFCANCGASLMENGEMPQVHLCALRLEGEAVIQLEEETEGKVELWFEDLGRLYAVLPIAPPEVEPAASSAAPFAQGVRHIVGYNSDKGLQRELDEDAMLVLTLTPMFESQSQPALGLYAVADGMGGHEGGEIASRVAVEQLAETMTKRLLLPELAGEPVLPESPAMLLTEAIQSINSTIFRVQQNTGSDMGTTLTAALVRDDSALIANVGDSRTYLWRDGELSQITEDHSLVAQLVEAGAIEAHEIYTHPEKSAIYRSLGHMPETEVDIFTQQLQPSDRLLLCCDGVWEMLRDEGIEEVLLLEPDPQRACDEIVRRSNLAGGEDNISVIIVQFESLENVSNNHGGDVLREQVGTPNL